MPITVKRKKKKTRQPRIWQNFFKNGEIKILPDKNPEKDWYN